MPLPAPRRPVALALMVLAPLMWSLAGPLARQVKHAGGFEMAFWRSSVAALFVFGALAILQRGRPFAALRAAGVPGLVSGAMWAIMFTCFILALTYTTVANVLVVASLGPFFTALLARAFLREPMPLRTWIAILAATAGMLAMFGAGFTAGEPRHLIGMALGLTIPTASAVNIVVLRKSGAHLDLMPAVMLGALLSAAMTLPLAVPFAASGRDLLFLATLGVVQLGAPCLLLVLVSRTLPAPEIALLALLEVVLGPLWTWLGAGEVPAGATLAGGALVLAALAGNELAALGRGRHV
ncbi:MAG TPA: DMT family transporter [Burkholderiales bacterium]|nr:DMT family transporter [Burkholderiales bacterium]